jgi:penicillin amidase
MRFLNKFLIFLFALIVIIGISVFAYLQYLIPNYNAELKLDGLKAKAEVLYDNYGIPHVYAENEEDLFEAFGYVHAQDRLFQMEILKRLADGRLAEVFGEKALQSDRFFRTLSLREHAKYSLKLTYADSTLPYVKVAKSYLRGINQYIKNGKTPIEFTLAGIPKQEFTLEDMLVITGYMGYTFVGTFKTESIATYVHNALGANYYNDIMQQWPDTAHRIPVQQQEKKRSDSTVRVLGMISSQMEHIADNLPYPPFQGSNGWVISGSKTKSGKPILSNDTHMGFAQPSVWYEAHLECPGYKVYGNFVAGVGLPALGHNQYGAWGLTMFENDDADLYREKSNPNNANQVWFKDHWEDMEVRKEVIKVKGKTDEILEVKKSRHGYILNGAFKDIDHIKEPIALWWVYLQMPVRHAEVFYALTKSKNVWDAATAVEPLTAPGLNFMWADTEGNIGWWAAGKLPIRPSHVDPQIILDGASGKDDIIGWYDFKDNPQIINPARGVLYTANNQPEDMGRGYIPGYYVPSDRAARIEELLFNDQNNWTEEELRKIINDVQATTYGTNISKVLPIIDQKIISADAKKAYSLLLNWKGQHELGSIEPTIYYRFIYHILINSFSDELGIGKMYELQSTMSWKRNLQSFLLNDSSAWWDDVKTQNRETRTEILTKSFNDAVNWLSKDMGNDMKQWTWGKVHTLEHKHPLGVVPLIGPYFNVGPFPVAGGRETVNNLTFNLDSTGRYYVTAGPALRRIVDLANPALAFSVNPTGQSGYFMSSHYDDQSEMFALGGKRPELMDRKSIEKVLKGRTVFKP